MQFDADGVAGSSARSSIVTLSGVSGVAKPLWGYPLDYVAIRGAGGGIPQRSAAISPQAGYPRLEPHAPRRSVWVMRPAD
jgi:hypothetical protein